MAFYKYFEQYLGYSLWVSVNIGVIGGVGWIIN